MKQQPTQTSQLSPLKLRPHGGLAMVSSLALILALSACGKQEEKESKTAGQQVDAAIAKTEQAAAEARVKAEQAAAEAKAKTESTLASAGTVLKDAASKAAEKMDDVAITAAVSSGIAKDSDLSMLKINVDTKDGTVTLNGNAPTEAARDKAGSIAKAVKGVRSVDNKLVVKAS